MLFKTCPPFGVSTIGRFPCRKGSEYFLKEKNVKLTEREQAFKCYASEVKIKQSMTIFNQAQKQK